jgi:hypothetical protein
MPTINLLIRRLLCEFLGHDFAQRADDPSLLICNRCRLLRRYISRNNPTRGDIG